MRIWFIAYVFQPHAKFASISRRANPLLETRRPQLPGLRDDPWNRAKRPRALQSGNSGTSTKGDSQETENPIGRSCSRFRRRIPAAVRRFLSKLLQILPEIHRQRLGKCPKNHFALFHSKNLLTSLGKKQMSNISYILRGIKSRSASKNERDSVALG